MSKDEFNLACSETPLTTEEINAYRKQFGLDRMPVYEPRADTGTRTRRADAKASEPYKDEVSANVNKTSVRAHSHYFRDVSKLTDLDVYRICDLFVDDRSGATQHALKKILLPGLRGVKDRMKDYQEAVDTLNRKIEMMKEDVK